LNICICICFAFFILQLNFCILNICIFCISAYQYKLYNLYRINKHYKLYESQTCVLFCVQNRCAEFNYLPAGSYLDQQSVDPARILESLLLEISLFELWPLQIVMEINLFAMEITKNRREVGSNVNCANSGIINSVLMFMLNQERL
jgi:hypothetical protein